MFVVFNPTSRQREIARHFQHEYFIVVLAMVSLGATIGCAIILEDQGELERVDAAFFYDPTSASIPSAYAVELSEQRIIRRIVVHSLDRIRNTDIYVRSGKKRGIHAKQIKSPFEKYICRVRTAHQPLIAPEGRKVCRDARIPCT